MRVFGAQIVNNLWTTNKPKTTIVLVSSHANVTWFSFAVGRFTWKYSFFLCLSIIFETYREHKQNKIPSWIVIIAEMATCISRWICFRIKPNPTLSRRSSYLHDKSYLEFRVFFRKTWDSTTGRLDLKTRLSWWVLATCMPANGVNI